MKNKEILYSPIPHLCDMEMMIVYLHPHCSFQTRLFLHFTTELTGKFKLRCWLGPICGAF